MGGVPEGGCCRVVEALLPVYRPGVGALGGDIHPRALSSGEKDTVGVL